MIEKIQYFIKRDGYGSAMEYHHSSNDPEYVAECFVENHDDHDGYYGDKTELELFDAGMNSLGVFTVYKEYTVNYLAYKKEVDNG